MFRVFIFGLMAWASVEGRSIRQAEDVACPFELLPVLKVCPPCKPTDCFCADGKKLTPDDQEKAFAVSWNPIQ